MTFYSADDRVLVVDNDNPNLNDPHVLLAELKIKLSRATNKTARDQIQNEIVGAKKKLNQSYNLVKETI